MRYFDPEPISVALFNLISDALKASDLGFREFSRRPTIGQNITPAKRPAFYLVQRDIDTAVDNWNLPVYTVRYAAYIAAWENAASKNELPETFLNKVFLVFSGQLFNRPNGEMQTLGGLVGNTWIYGPSPIVQGIVPGDELWRIIEIAAKTGI